MSKKQHLFLHIFKKKSVGPIFQNVGPISGHAAVKGILLGLPDKTNILNTLKTLLYQIISSLPNHMGTLTLTSVVTIVQGE